MGSLQIGRSITGFLCPYRGSQCSQKRYACALARAYSPSSTCPYYNTPSALSNKKSVRSNVRRQHSFSPGSSIFPLSSSTPSRRHRSHPKAVSSERTHIASYLHGQQRTNSTAAGTTATATPTPYSDTHLPPSTQSQVRFNAPKTTYHVLRTRSNNLPVYEDLKAGRTLKLTIVRRVHGNSTDLRDELMRPGVLEPTPLKAEVNTLNGHVTVKGLYKGQIVKYLLSRGF